MRSCLHWTLFNTRLKENYQHICLEHTNKSAGAEHSINLGHNIQLHNTSIFSAEPRYTDHIIRGRMQIELQPSNMNLKNGFCLSNSCKPFFCAMEDHRKPPSQNSTDGFSSHPHRSVHTVLINASTPPSPDTHQPYSLLSCPSFRLLLLLLYPLPHTEFPLA